MVGIAKWNQFIYQKGAPSSQQSLADIRPERNEIYPEHTFKYYFLNDQYEHQYHNDMQFGKSDLLFTHMVMLRTKEIGVRKVFGASVLGLVRLISSEFTKLVLIAVVIGIPVAWYFMESWLQTFAYRTSID